MVSIIIPTYNYARYIAETLRSVQQQSYSNFECLIIDNGSTDNTKEVVSEFLNDGRFRYFFQHNKGVSAGRNKGLKEAKGRFIQFLDADDLIEKEKLKASVEYLDAHHGTDLVYSDMRYFLTEKPEELYFSYRCEPANDLPWMSYFSGSGKELAEQLLKGNMMVISSPVFRKERFRDFFFREDILHNEDWDFWLRMALEGSNIRYLDAPETKTLVRIHQKSASRDVFKMQVCGLRVLLNNKEKMEAHQLHQPLKARINEHVRAVRASLFRMFKASQFKEAIKFLAEKNLYSVIFPFNAGSGVIARLYLLIKRLTG